MKDLVRKYPVRARIIRETNIKDDEDFPQIEGLTYEPSKRLS